MQELAEEQKRLVEFGKWEEELDAAILQGKTVSDVTAQVSGEESIAKVNSDESTEKPNDEEPSPKPSTTKQHIAPPIDAEGKPISVDNHWKQFLATNKPSGKPAGGRRNEKRTSTMPSSSSGKKEKRVESFFDDEKETRPTKKIPLKRK